jgi:4-diphosphocytidyl-2-C-methyl-D-erythritol kinase
MVFNSYSKINLSLNINKQLKNGLHEIQSYFCLINLSDKIKVSKTYKKKDIIIFKGQFAKYVKTSNNSIRDLLKLLRKLKLISSYYSVVVTKNIPVFGGLGGGTGNAASLLKFLLKKKINKSILNKAEKLLGSDLRIFFYKQGFLKNLKTICRIKKYQIFYFLLVNPYRVRCSTREIYAKVKKYSKKSKFNIYTASTKSKFINYLSNNSNELQSIVEKKYPIIKKLLRDISFESGCYFSRMSGSGSVCYGIFNNKRDAKNALNKIKTKYPKFWFSIAKTV